MKVYLHINGGDLYNSKYPIISEMIKKATKNPRDSVFTVNGEFCSDQTDLVVLEQHNDAFEYFVEKKDNPEYYKTLLNILQSKIPVFGYYCTTSGQTNLYQAKLLSKNDKIYVFLQRGTAQYIFGEVESIQKKRFEQPYTEKNPSSDWTFNPSEKVDLDIPIIKGKFNRRLLLLINL